MKISLTKLHITDAESLFAFELKNRAFFEKMVPTRGEEYYDFERFKNNHENLLNEQAQGISYFYLIKDEEDAIIGRINLVDIDKPQNLGYLGYRIGQAYTRKGIASKALQLLLETVTSKGVKQIKAKTTTHNIASQRVLEKNEFQHIATDEEEFEMNGQKLQFVYYMWSK